jgi:hypothetical protein
LSGKEKDLPVGHIEYKTYFIFQELPAVVANTLKDLLDFIDKA